MDAHCGDQFAQQKMDIVISNFSVIKDRSGLTTVSIHLNERFNFNAKFIKFNSGFLCGNNQVVGMFLS